jgi:hypothetical protein
MRGTKGACVVVVLGLSLAAPLAATPGSCPTDDPDVKVVTITPGEGNTVSVDTSSVEVVVDEQTVCWQVKADRLGAGMWVEFETKAQSQLTNPLDAAGRKLDKTQVSWAAPTPTRTGTWRYNVLLRASGPNGPVTRHTLDPEVIIKGGSGGVEAP